MESNYENVNNIFIKYINYEDHKNILSEPLQADCNIRDFAFCHFQKCYAIKDNNIEYVNKNIVIKDRIDCLYFVYTDFGEYEYDDKYWFFIGKLSNNIYFSYESGCCGTGFGLGSTSTIYLSKQKNLLCKYGLTDKQRKLIENNIKTI